MTPDEADGQRIREIRTSRGMRQVDVADAMRECGWKWVQSTVWHVEQGTRPTRLSEAVDLALILNVPLTELIGAADPAPSARRAGYLDGYKAGIAAARMTLDDLPTKPLRLPY